MELALFSFLETELQVLSSTLYHPIPQLHFLFALRDFRQSLLCKNQEQIRPYEGHLRIFQSLSILGT